MRFEKKGHELVFRILLNICDIAFLRKYLTAKSFIVDIRPGSKYASDERNKLFSFQIKATLKATTLGICMCCTECYSGKIRKVRIVTPWLYIKGLHQIFHGIFNTFFGQAISHSFRPLISKGFYLLRMSNDYCFRGGA